MADNDLPDLPLINGPDLPRSPGGVVLPNPAISQRDVDLSNIIRENTEAYKNLQLVIERNLERQETHLKNITASQKDSLRSVSEEASHKIKLADLEDRRLKTLQKIRDSESKGITALRQQFRLGEQITKQGQLKYVDPEGRARTISPEQYLSKDFPEAERQQIREQLASHIATSDSPSFRISEFIGKLAHGDIGGAIGEGFQSLPVFDNLTEGLMQHGEGLSAHGAALRTAGKALRDSAGTFPQTFMEGVGQRVSGLGVSAEGGLASLRGGLISSIAPKLFTPAMIYGLQREIRQGLRSYQDDLRQGMQGGLTGTAAARETFGANLRARFEGINPFDALTTQMAREIARGIQSEGFTGTVRAAWQDSVTDVIKSTGMDAGQALQLMSTAANQLGENAQQFRADMMLVEQTAKATSLSVNQAAQSFQAMQQSLFTRGGAPALAPAGQLSTTLARALPRAVVARGALASAIGQNWQTLVARAGINPALAFEPQIIRQASQVLDSIVGTLYRIKNSSDMTKNMPVQKWVSFMEGASSGFFEQLLPGATNADIVAFMRRGRNNGYERAQRQTVADTARARTRTVHHHHGILGTIAREVSGGLQSIATSAGKGADYAINQATGSHTHLARDLFNPNSIANSDIDFAATRRNMIKAFGNEIEGLTPEQRRQVLAPLRNASSYDELMGGAVNRAQEIVVRLHPNAERVLQAEPSRLQRYHDYNRGTSNSQGMVRPVK